MRNLIAILTAVTLLAGCDLQPARLEATPKPPPTPPGRTDVIDTQGVAAPHDEKPTDSAVDTALQWAQRYAEVSQKLAESQAENKQLLNEKQAQAEKVTKLQDDLAKTQGQLKDANTMLMDMKRELEKWKDNVLTYRSEMRDAQAAQMNVLVRIVKLLGGDTGDIASRPAPAAPATTRISDE